MAEKTPVADRITEYLSNGGFFNPESMEHDKVRDLLIDCRDALGKIEAEARACAVEDVIARFKAIGFLGTEALKELAPLPSTHCVVPLEPTDKMAQAAWDIQTDPQPQAIKAMYKAMIKARPK